MTAPGLIGRHLGLFRIALQAYPPFFANKCIVMNVCSSPLVAWDVCVFVVVLSSFSSCTHTYSDQDRVDSSNYNKIREQILSKIEATVDSDSEKVGGNLWKLAKQAVRHYHLHHQQQRECLSRMPAHEMLHASIKCISR